MNFRLRRESLDLFQAQFLLRAPVEGQSSHAIPPPARLVLSWNPTSPSGSSRIGQDSICPPGDNWCNIETRRWTPIPGLGASNANVPLCRSLCADRAYGLDSRSDEKLPCEATQKLNFGTFLGLLNKTSSRERFGDALPNERQRLLVNRLLDGILISPMTSRYQTKGSLPGRGKRTHPVSDAQIGGCRLWFSRKTSIEKCASEGAAR